MAVSIRFPGETVEVSDEILQKYDVNAPRYTSYPPSPSWDDSFDQTRYRALIAESNAADRPLSLYMHLPFCEQLCLFCGCNVIVRHDHSGAASYLPLLKQEIDALTAGLDAGRPVVQFHWGGGTPTYFSPEQLSDLFTFTRQRVSFADDAEIGVELDPRVTTTDHLDALKKLGFNRLSLGVQDFDPVVQAAINRIQPYQQVEQLVSDCRGRGFASLNFDLIYGLPHQTVETFSRTIDQVIGLAPDRIALFSFGFVPWVKKQQQVLTGTIPLGGQKFELFALGLERLTQAGYVYVGMDHFARPDDELCLAQRNGSLHRNFQGYTTKSGADLFACGITGISELGRSYAQNVRGLHDYETALDQGKLPTLRGVELSDEDVIRRAVVGDLLCHGLVDKARFGQRWGIDVDRHFAAELERIKPLIADGLVEDRDDAIRATTLGRIFIRCVAMVFDEYLREPSAGPRHSRTV